ncbi:MAG: hypothetical protein GX946_02680 [Oligosphaeraceae bacterium]|nr:hypothetical protein [Oligosphaeraceae bacterium]
MNSTENKLDQIVAALEREEKSIRFSYRLTLLGYILLVLIIAGYSLWLSARISKELTPKNAALLLNTQVCDSLPELRMKLKENMQPFAASIVTHTAQSVGELIPVASNLLKKQIETFADSIMDRLEEDHIAEIEKFCIDCLDEVFAKGEALTDDEIADALVTGVIDDINREMDKILSHETLAGITDLGERLKAIREIPVQNASKQQYAEKMFIIYWLQLLEKGEIGSLGTIFKTEAE